jgi:hypothetical protein
VGAFEAQMEEAANHDAPPMEKSHRIIWFKPLAPPVPADSPDIENAIKLLKKQFSMRSIMLKKSPLRIKAKL